MEDISITNLLVLHDEVSSFLETISTSDLSKVLDSLKENNYLKDRFKRFFPKLTSTEINNILLMIVMEKEKLKENENEVSFVGTFPTSINSELRQTISVVRQMILEANESIMITGYSISEFINEIIELLLFKAEQGVIVQFFIDNKINWKGLFYPKFKNANFEVYKYKRNDNFSSLHAKVIIADNKKAFVSSSNLSYNGLVNNIEIGTIVTGKEVKKISGLFNTLLNNNQYSELIL